MFERSALTLTLCDLLRATNGTLSWQAIEQATGRPLSDLRQTLRNVRLYLERDEGIVFETVRREGLRRLTDAEKVASAARFTRTIHRTAGRGAQRLDAVTDFASLSNADQLAATIRRTVFEAVRRETSLDKGEGRG